MPNRQIPLASDRETQEIQAIIERTRGGERPDIEFKRDLFLDSKSQKAELAKDVALQANLQDGGNIIFGIDNDGTLRGSAFSGSEEIISSVLTQRLYYAPPGIKIVEASVRDKQNNQARVIWLKIPKTPYAVPCSFLDVDCIAKMPIRIGTTTKYLSPMEAVEHYRGRLGQPIHPDEVSSEILSRYPGAVKETIETNLLPITKPPRFVTLTKTNAQTETDLIGKYGLPPFPIRLWNGNAVCLRNEEDLTGYMDSESEARSVSADEFTENLDQRRVVLGLLNMELLWRAENLGFMVDRDKQRVFLRRQGDNAVKHSWQSFSRRATRTVVGSVLGPDGIPRYWYHFGAYLRVKMLMGDFFVTVNPTWVFTKDGTELIDKERSQSLSSTKLNRERNDRVLYNLHLLYQLLSENKSSFRLPLAHGQGEIKALPVTCDMTRGIAGDSIQTSELDLDMDSEIPVPSQIRDKDDEVDDVQDFIP